MTQKERSAKHYKSRKESGLCPRCGKSLDRDGHYCIKCNKNHNEYTKISREFFRKHHICTECGKVKVPENERICLECRAKRKKYRKPLTEKQKNNFRKQQNSLYQQRKKQGICTRCGKAKAMPGKAKCGVCLAKDAEIHRKRYMDRPNIKEYRKDNHLCYYCGNEIDLDKGQLCSSCLEKCKLNGIKSGGGNEYWKQDNNLIFKNKV